MYCEGYNMHKSFKDIILTYQARIRAYIAGLGVPIESVDDIAQEVFIQYYNSIHEKPEDTHILPWLKGIAKNISLNYFRSRKRRSYHHTKAAEMLVSVKNDLEDQHERHDISNALHECLQELAPKSKMVLFLRYNNGLKSHKIGEKIGATGKAIRMSLVRIRKILKKCIERKIGQEYRYES